MLEPTPVLAEGGLDLIQGLAIFALAAFLMAFGVLLFGKLIRPHVLNPDKAKAYECGEQPIGPAWVQFDLRFYVVALVFLVFDVEIALFYPWAVVYGGGALGAGEALNAGGAALRQVRWAALWDMLFFFGVIVVGFVYLWRFGYLDWVRSAPGPSEFPAAEAKVGQAESAGPATGYAPGPAAPSPAAQPAASVPGQPT